MKEDGTIFISIDHNEFSQLKLVCDEIFGESSYLNQISVNSKVSAGASGEGKSFKYTNVMIMSTPYLLGKNLRSC